jgi:hypothetical protein
VNIFIIVEFVLEMYSFCKYYYNVLKCENYLSQHVFYVNSIMTIIYHIFKFDFAFRI